MKARASSPSGSRVPGIHSCGAKEGRICLVYLFISLPIIMGFTFPESFQGWKSATFNISAKRLDSIMRANDNTSATVLELYCSAPRQTGKEGAIDYIENFDDEYHLNRYFGVPNYTAMIIPKDTKEKILSGSVRHFRTDDVEYTFDNVTGLSRFTFFKIVRKTVPGRAFDLPEVENVVFWQHRRYSDDRVFLVEFVIRDPEVVEAVKKHYSQKYGEAWEDAFGRGKLLSVAYIWGDQGASIRIVETKRPVRGLKRESSYSLVFSNIERADGVLIYLHTLMKLAPYINPGSDSVAADDGKK